MTNIILGWGAPKMREQVPILDEDTAGHFDAFMPEAYEMMNASERKLYESLKALGGSHDAS